jgi:hypothetical protein
MQHARGARLKKMQLLRQHRLLATALLVLLLVAGIIQAVHVHAGISPDCTICVTAHSPATASPAVLLVLVFTVLCTVAVAAFSPDRQASVLGSFIRPPPVSVR